MVLEHVKLVGAQGTVAVGVEELHHLSRVVPRGSKLFHHFHEFFYADPTVSILVEQAEDAPSPCDSAMGGLEDGERQAVMKCTLHDIIYLSLFFLGGRKYDISLACHFVLSRLCPVQIPTIFHDPSPPTHFTISSADRIMKNAGKSNNSQRANLRADARKDRKSAVGVSGSPKKGDHGGKFMWSGDGYSWAEMGLAREEAVDAKDPNFEDPKEDDEARAPWFDDSLHTGRTNEEPRRHGRPIKGMKKTCRQMMNRRGGEKRKTEKKR